MQDIKDLFNLKLLKPFDRLVYLVLLILVFTSAYAFVYKLNNKFSTNVPEIGGTLNEGVIDTARFINPALASSETDLDLTRLVYSSLMKSDGEGNLTPDIAKEYTVSEDGKEYTFKLKQGVKFHDGHELTSADVVFTIETIQNPTVKSPLRPAWLGVKTEAIDKYTVKFTLPKAYAPFIENTTVGILPKHIWQAIEPKNIQFSIYNEHPIGSGPYVLDSVEKNELNIPLVYHLKPNMNYFAKRPNIENINIHIYPNSQERLNAWQNGDINAVASVQPSNLKNMDLSDSNVYKITYPRIFALFINRKASIKHDVRKALSLATDKDAIINNVFNGYAKKINSPFINQKNVATEEIKDRKKQIEKLMQKDGWTLNEDNLWSKDDKVFKISISTNNNDEIKKVAYEVQKSWKKFGFDVQIKYYNLGELSKKIRERDFEVLLFGEAPGRSEDMYAFWHSSQKDDPGLNISGYINKKVDKLLAKMKTSRDRKEKDKMEREIAKEITNDVPAIFLYSPDFIYILPKELRGFENSFVAFPYERFTNIQNWYFNSERLWSFNK